MSRHPINYANSTNVHESEKSEQYIQFIAESATPKAMTLQQIKNATQNDPTFCRQQAADIIQQNSWHMLDTKNLVHQPDVDLRELKLLRNVKNELTISREKNLICILRGTRIVIPKSLRADAIRLAHLGHQRIVKTKSLMQEKVWFPLIDSLVKAEIDACLPCQATDAQTHHNLYKCAKYPKKTSIRSTLTF